MDEVVVELIRCKTENENLKNQIEELNKENYTLKKELASYRPVMFGMYIKDEVQPDEILLLVDAMSGQDAVNVATTFNAQLALTGAVMSKLDGDARGGAALSIKHMTGVPIKFSGVGEKLTDLDIFYPDRMADRILGMGDVMTLVEKAQEELDEKEMKKAANKMAKGKFDLEDMIAQMKQIQKLGSLGGLMKLIPGMPKVTPEQTEAVEKQMKLFGKKFSLLKI